MDGPIEDHINCCEDTRDTAKDAPVDDHIDCCEDTRQPGTRQGPAGTGQLY